MSYIYTVKPIKEAIKIATQYNDFEINNSGETSIYGVDTTRWPGGVKIKSAERITTGYIKIEENGYALPTRYFTIEECDVVAVPEFIRNLYEAIRKPCAYVSCFKCPLNYVSVADCDKLAAWLERTYPEL